MADNKFPIVFVHGWMGWGQDELGNLQYWGGEKDQQEELRAKGYCFASGSYSTSTPIRE